MSFLGDAPSLNKSKHASISGFDFLEGDDDSPAPSPRNSGRRASKEESIADLIGKKDPTLMLARDPAKKKAANLLSFGGGGGGDLLDSLAAQVESRKYEEPDEPAESEPDEDELAFLREFQAQVGATESAIPAAGSQLDSGVASMIPPDSEQSDKMEESGTAFDLDDLLDDIDEKKPANPKPKPKPATSRSRTSETDLDGECERGRARSQTAPVSEIPGSRAASDSRQPSPGPQQAHENCSLSPGLSRAEPRGGGRSTSPAPGGRMRNPGDGFGNDSQPLSRDRSKDRLNTFENQEGNTSRTLSRDRSKGRFDANETQPADDGFATFNSSSVDVSPSRTERRGSAGLPPTPPTWAQDSGGTMNRSQNATPRDMGGQTPADSNFENMFAAKPKRKLSQSRSPDRTPRIDHNTSGDRFDSQASVLSEVQSDLPSEFTSDFVVDQPSRQEDVDLDALLKPKPKRKLSQCGSRNASPSPAPSNRANSSQQMHDMASTGPSPSAKSLAASQGPSPSTANVDPSPSLEIEEEEEEEVGQHSHDGSLRQGSRQVAPDSALTLPIKRIEQPEEQAISVRSGHSSPHVGDSFGAPSPYGAQIDYDRPASKDSIQSSQSSPSRWKESSVMSADPSGISMHHVSEVRGAPSGSFGDAEPSPSRSRRAGRGEDSALVTPVSASPHVGGPSGAGTPNSSALFMVSDDVLAARAKPTGRKLGGGKAKASPRVAPAPENSEASDTAAVDKGIASAGVTPAGSRAGGSASSAFSPAATPAAANASAHLATPHSHHSPTSRVSPQGAVSQPTPSGMAEAVSQSMPGGMLADRRSPGAASLHSYQQQSVAHTPAGRSQGGVSIHSQQQQSVAHTPAGRSQGGASIYSQPSHHQAVEPFVTGRSPGGASLQSQGPGASVHSQRGTPAGDISSASVGLQHSQNFPGDRVHQVEQGRARQRSPTQASQQRSSPVARQAGSIAKPQDFVQTLFPEPDSAVAGRRSSSPQHRGPGTAVAFDSLRPPDGALESALLRELGSADQVTLSRSQVLQLQGQLAGHFAGHVQGQAIQPPASPLTQTDRSHFSQDVRGPTHKWQQDVQLARFQSDLRDSQRLQPAPAEHEPSAVLHSQIGTGTPVSEPLLSLWAGPGGIDPVGGMNVGEKPVCPPFPPLSLAPSTDVLAKLAVADAKNRHLELQLEDEKQRGEERLAEAKKQWEAERENMDLNCRKLESDLARLKDVHATDRQYLNGSKDMLLQNIEIEKDAIRRDERRKSQFELDKIRAEHSRDLEDMRRKHERALSIVQQQADSELEGLRKSFGEQQLNSVVKQVVGAMQDVQGSTRRVENDRYSLQQEMHERRLAARERSAKELEERLQLQAKELEEQRRRVVDLVRRLEDGQVDDRQGLALERDRLQTEHVRLAELQKTLRDADRNHKEQLKHAWSQLEEERRSFTKERIRIEGDLQARKEELESREHRVQQEVDRLKLLHEQVENARAGMAKRIRESEAAIAGERRCLMTDLEVFEQKKKMFADEVERVETQSRQVQQDRTDFEEEVRRVGLMAVQINQRSAEVADVYNAAHDAKEVAGHLRAQIMGERSMQFAELEKLKTMQSLVERQRLQLLQTENKLYSQGPLPLPPNQAVIVEKVPLPVQDSIANGALTSPPQQVVEEVPFTSAPGSRQLPVAISAGYPGDPRAHARERLEFQQRLQRNQEVAADMHLYLQEQRQYLEGGYFVNAPNNSADTRFEGRGIEPDPNTLDLMDPLSSDVGDGYLSGAS